MSSPEIIDLAITATARVTAPRDVAFAAWTDATRLTRWFSPAAEIELRPGGAFEMYFLLDAPAGSRGGEGNTIQSFLPGRILCFTWNAPPSFPAQREERTWVLVTFDDLSLPAATAPGTLVTLRHYGWRPGEDWRRVHDYFAAAWPRVLKNLETHLGPAPAENPQAAQNDRVDYLEFVTPELDATKSFFSAAFGWSFTDYGPDYAAYHDGRLAGGFRRGEHPAATNPLPVVFATDLEATERRVVAAGAPISTPTHEFPGGRRFHAIAPGGIEIAVWSDRRADGSPIS